MIKLRTVILIVLLVIAGGAILAMINQKHKMQDSMTKEEIQKEGADSILLVDCRRNTVATVGGNHYSGAALYRNKDGSCEIHIYSKEESDREEQRSIAKADAAAVEEVYSIIQKNRIEKWNKQKGGSDLDGVVYTLGFRDSDDRYMEVSSDRMPENGIAVMDQITAVLRQYAEEDNTSGKNRTIQISVRNQIGKAHDAYIWIAPDNQENHEASTWTASCRGLDVGEALDISVAESPDGSYLIKMTDAGDLYYEADGILLENGQALVVKDGDFKRTGVYAVAIVQDEKGNIVGSYDMFMASL